MKIVAFHSLPIVVYIKSCVLASIKQALLKETPQTVNQACNRKNSEEQFKNCKNFCLLRQLQMAVTYIRVSSLI